MINFNQINDAFFSFTKNLENTHNLLSVYPVICIQHPGTLNEQAGVGNAQKNPLISVIFLFLSFSTVASGQTISGSILNTGGQPVGGGIRLFESSGDIVDHFWTDHLGHFQTAPLPDGSYFAVTLNTSKMLDEAWDDIPCENLVCDVTSTTPILINGGDQSGIDFVLEAIPGGAHISGKLTGPGGPLVNTGVSILNRNSGHLMDLRTDSDGD